MFKVAGVSKNKGKFKVRFANDMARVKNLDKSGHTNIDLIELPKAMSKPDVVKYLLGRREFTGEAREAIKLADVKYNGAKTVKVKAKAKTAKVKAAPKATPETTPEVAAEAATDETPTA